MSLLNPVLSPSLTTRKAASLKTTFSWYARHGWLLLEASGRRRAAAELERVAMRLQRDGDSLADGLRATAAELKKR